MNEVEIEQALFRETARSVLMLQKDLADNALAEGGLGFRGYPVSLGGLRLGRS